MARRLGRGRAWGNALGGYKRQNRKGGKFTRGFGGKSTPRKLTAKQVKRRKVAKVTAKTLVAAGALGAGLYFGNSKKYSSQRNTINRSIRGKVFDAKLLYWKYTESDRVTRKYWNKPPPRPGMVSEARAQRAHKHAAKLYKKQMNRTMRANRKQTRKFVNSAQKRAKQYNKRGY